MDLSNLTYIVSATLALVILIDVSVLWLTGKQVPELLAQLVVAVFTTYVASNLSRARSGQTRLPSTQDSAKES